MIFSMEKTIKIGGAGIAGLTAAINLAKAGYKIEVYDAASDSGKRFNNDFQGIENWSDEQDALDFLKSIKIELNFDHQALNKVSAWAPKGCHRDFELSHPAYYLVRRGVGVGTLDQGLKEQALKNGVKIFYDHSVKPNEVDIVATGPFSNDPKTDIIASGYVFKTDLEDLGVLILDDQYASDGYSYFLVRSGRATIATCIFKNFNRLKQYREKTLELCKKYKQFKMEDIKIFSGTGNFFLPEVPKDKRIYIGESGGFQDFLWGFGMKYAMKSGYLAAKSIIEGKDFYKLYQKDLLPRMKVSVVNRLIFAAFGNDIYRLFVGYYSTKIRDPLEFLGKIYRFSLFRLAPILYPIAALILRKNIRDPRNILNK